MLRSQALGIDDRPVLSPAVKSYILEEETLAEDSNDDALLLGILYRMTENACIKMRQKGILPRTLWMHIRHADGVDAARRKKLSLNAVMDRTVFAAVREVYIKCTERRQRVRYMSLTFTDLIPPDPQLRLFDHQNKNTKEQALISALDHIRGHFGFAAVRWGRTE